MQPKHILDCPLCSTGDESIIYQNNLFRVILVNDQTYPGFVRLILNDHIAEMSELLDETAIIIFKTVLTIEKVLRGVFKPDKINLASLGNVVPHLHWHIIPRYKHDKHFPNPIWGKSTNNNYIADERLFVLERELVTELKLTLGC